MCVWQWLKRYYAVVIVGSLVVGIVVYGWVGLQARLLRIETRIAAIELAFAQERPTLRTTLKLQAETLVELDKRMAVVQALVEQATP